MIKEFEAVRKWSGIRGIGSDKTQDLYVRLQSQYQRVLQETVEIHEAMVKNDTEEFIDALGDTLVTLINIAKIKGVLLENCLESAFGVIELRKGLITPEGDFVRYAKLSDEDKLICDEKQGNPGNQYFLRENMSKLSPDSFLR